MESTKYLVPPFFLGLFGSELIDLISEVHDFVTKAKMLILHRGEV